MDAALGLVGLLLYIVAVITLAGAVTYVVVRLTSMLRRKPETAG